MAVSMPLGCKGRKMIFWYLTIAFLVVPPALADRILSPNTGTMFHRNSHEPKYRIEFHSVMSPFHLYNEQESVIMSDGNGKRYKCFLPLVEETKSRFVMHANNSGILVGTDRVIKLKTPDDLLDALREKCMVRHEGWWTYEFCYHQKIRQLHLEDTKIIQEFVLGEYDPEATSIYNQNRSDSSTLKDLHFKDASQRYHSHLFTNGTLCDLTNRPRETEVRFICSDSMPLITSIKEVSTCKYAVTIQSSLLCKHPLFQEERSTWHTIHCNELSPVAESSEFGESSQKQAGMIMDGAGHYAT